VSEELKWETFEVPPYIPDLAPRDYLLFLNFKKMFSGQSLRREPTDKRRCEGVAVIRSRCREVL
jgi:hypothetical protein